MKTTLLYINIYRREDEFGAYHYDTSDNYFTKEIATFEAAKWVKNLKAWTFVKTIEVELND